LTFFTNNLLTAFIQKIDWHINKKRAFQQIHSPYYYYYSMLIKNKKPGGKK